MTRTLTPFTHRFPQLFEFEPRWPKWMAEIVGPEAGTFGRMVEYAPEANMTETEKAVEIAVELPGMKPEEVKVEMHGGALWITGEKRDEKEEKGKTFHQVERRYGAFRRVFALPAEVEEGKVEAKFLDGVLRVTLPKTERAVPRKIEVK
jgi:HSP20 family protein